MRLLVIGYGIERQQSGKKLARSSSTYITSAINSPTQFLSSLPDRSTRARARAGRGKRRIYEVVGFGFSAISLTGLGEWFEGGRYQGGRKEPTASVLRQRARFAGGGGGVTPAPSTWF